jgi:hypothetical protein
MTWLNFWIFRHDAMRKWRKIGKRTESWKINLLLASLRTIKKLKNHRRRIKSKLKLMKLWFVVILENGPCLHSKCWLFQHEMLNQDSYVSTERFPQNSNMRPFVMSSINIIHTSVLTGLNWPWCRFNLQPFNSWKARRKKSDTGMMFARYRDRCQTFPF